MGRGSKGGCDSFSVWQDGVKDTGGLHSGLFVPLLLEKDAGGKRNQILRGTLPQIVGERDPINLSLPIALEKGRCPVPGWAICSQFSGKDEVALFGAIFTSSQSITKTRPSCVRNRLLACRSA